MPKLDEADPYNWARALAGADDETVRLPLWTFPPEAVPYVMHERRVRFQWDDEPIGDPEYN
ncbi:hypothetical protein HOS59_gp33 [Streptomyces phage Rowa]|uniref:Uncharacterized protein n=1 Tax=Streptomyces phage Rowa TaxID=2059883 RepID=A0A2H5BLV7_9CAUD|nr:hypothetical protein HOS59_gp33 [Streptomyces phage Rowa]AUG87297.1 hypothetical protein SEA_ROWA_33 [Streptomyces phage Rowa]